MSVNTELAGAKIRAILEELSEEEARSVLSCLAKKSGYKLASNLILSNYKFDITKTNAIPLSDIIDMVECATGLEFQTYMDLIEDKDAPDNEYFVDAAVDFEEELYLLFGETL